jgi:putative copper export protein
VRWLAFVGLALVLGGLGFRLCVLPQEPLPERLLRRFYALAIAGAVIVLEAGLLAFLLRADGALKVPFERFLYSDLSPLASTRFGTAFVAMTLGFVLVGAFVFLAWLTDRDVLLWPAFALAIVFASGFSLSGHSAGEPNSSGWSALADWTHLVAASFWAGGLAMLLLTVVSAPDLRRPAFTRFARLAPVLIALLVAAGTYLAVLRLPQPSDLWTTSYGHVLLVKLGLVALALLWGAFHHFVVEPRLDSPRVVARLPKSLAGEAAVGMAVLLLAAVLVNSAPPVPKGSAEAVPARAGSR